MSSKPTTIPSEAIEWITKKVAKDSGYMNSRLSRFDLDALTAVDLKHLCKAIEMDSGHRVILRGYKSGNKNSIIQLIRNHFYTDYPDCKKPNVAWINQQMTAAGAPSGSASLPQAAAASATTPAQRYPEFAAMLAQINFEKSPSLAKSRKAGGRPKAPAAPSGSASLPQAAAASAITPAQFAAALSQINFEKSPPLATSRKTGSLPPASILPALHPSSMAYSMQEPPGAVTTMPPPLNAPHPVVVVASHHHRNKRTHAGGLAEQKKCGSETSGKRKHHKKTSPVKKSAHVQTGPNSSSSSSASRVSNSPPVYIKPECAFADPDSTALNPTETNAVAQLQQMSFTDPREILFSCRKLCRETGSEPSVDSIMLDIITQREEADEARQMDEARKLSELSRKEDAKQRRDELVRELQSTIESSTVDVWLRDKRMFVQSWILRGDVKASLQRWITTQRTTFKLKLIDLLKLEKKSQKWYGDMPRSYFAGQLMQRLVPMTTAETMRAQIHREINTLETAMYGLSQQTGGVPKVFRDAHDEALAEKHERREDEDDAVLLVQSTRPTGTMHDQSQVGLSSAAASFEVIDLSYGRQDGY